MVTFSLSTQTIVDVTSHWSFSDILTHIKLRWSIGRRSAKVKPGIYRLGKPTPNSDVFVSANYTLSFNHLRKSLKGIDAWILVIDTKGVNVWCAAGKGTFGTNELIQRIKQHNIKSIVTHNRLIVPQLGATGVSAHHVKEETGFRVIYGPVEAKNIKNFISNGYKASREMRTVNFSMWDRIKLVPVELAYGKYYLILVPVLFLILSGVSNSTFSITNLKVEGTKSIINLFAAFVSGCVITPIFLPNIPFKRFSLKGFVVSIFTVSILFFFKTLGDNIVSIISWILVISSISSFLAMNFTGSSTFTSLSGVKKEMKTALPIQIAAGSIGTILWIIIKYIETK